MNKCRVCRRGRSKTILKRWIDVIPINVALFQEEISGPGQHGQKESKSF